MQKDAAKWGSVLLAYSCILLLRKVSAWKEAMIVDGTGAGDSQDSCDYCQPCILPCSAFGCTNA